jgi:hypothetical protein
VTDGSDGVVPLAGLADLEPGEARRRRYLQVSRRLTTLLAWCVLLQAVLERKFQVHQKAGRSSNGFDCGFHKPMFRQSAQAGVGRAATPPSPRTVTRRERAPSRGAHFCLKIMTQREWQIAGRHAHLHYANCSADDLRNFPASRSQLLGNGRGWSA